MKSLLYSHSLTSLISLILEPPLPMSEPHWLAGMTSRSVTGGLLVTVPFATRAAKSLRDKHRIDSVFNGKWLKIWSGTRHKAELR